MIFKELLFKEIQESLLDFRSWLVFALCLLLIPLGMYVSRKDYESRLNEYKRDIEIYREASFGNVGADFSAKGFHPPSQLSVFSNGFGDHLPHHVETSRDGYFRIYSKLGTANLQSVLFGKVDFTFIVINFLSLLAIVFTFSSISAEKERGTLKLVLSNSVPRVSFIFAKILGGFLVFFTAFIISFIIGLLIINYSETINIFQPDFIHVTLLVLFSTLLFLFMLFNLGTWISAITRNSINAAIFLIFLWMIMALGIPKVSPMIANIITPVESEELYHKEFYMVKNQLENERDKEEKELLEFMVAEQDIHFTDFFEEFYNTEYSSLREEYDNASIIISDDYSKRISSAIQKIEENHQNKKLQQAILAMNLTRISPAGSYSFLITELSGTGLLEIENFQERSQQFQDKVSQDIYDNFIYSRYWYEGFRTAGISAREGFDEKNLTVPEMNHYTNPAFKKLVQQTWIDLIILFLYTTIFFYAAFVSFLRFDVR
jgi:ABC-2 type transport system permease protein